MRAAQEGRVVLAALQGRLAANEQRVVERGLVGQQPETEGAQQERQEFQPQAPRGGSGRRRGQCWLVAPQVMTTTPITTITAPISLEGVIVSLRNRREGMRMIT